MKKIISLILIILVIGGGVAAWVFLGPATSFESAKQNLYIRTGAATKEAVLDSLNQNKIISNSRAFEFLAARMGLWKNVKPGKYEIKKGSSLLTIIRTLRNGHQVPVNLVIIKLRTIEDLARTIGNKFECDSLDVMHFLSSKDSLHKINLDDSSTALFNVLPDTYILKWNMTPSQILQRLAHESSKFWTEVRKQKATAQGLTPVQAYTLASIIEEETNYLPEKPNIASTYLNRLNRGMPLQADPTIKFAMRNFSLRRIYEKYLFIESPYNTYRNKGLPPGPICTPSRKTIDAVLDAPKTDYLYFVANSSFNGSHVFSSSYAEHMKNAHAYQAALNRMDSLKNRQQP